jgi:predicted MPP superfamily phosphohydrolase
MFDNAVTKGGLLQSATSPRNTYGGDAYSRPEWELMPVPPPRVREHVVRIKGLDPRHEGVRIAQLSDIHVGNMTPASHVRAAVSVANAANPDLVMLTGDYVCWRRHEAELAGDQLGGLRARRVLAVLGNHDYFTWGAGVAGALRKNGYDVLKNQLTVMEINGAPIAIIGIDDPVTRHDDLDAAFSGVPDKLTKLVLCHAPDRAPALAERGADLVLSGHTHGGQIYVKGITDRVMKKVGLNYRRGFFGFGDTTLYVTPGVGFSGVTRRLGEGTDAEVALLTLRAA